MRKTMRAALVASASLVALAAPARAQDEPARPCEAGGVYDDFDFWIGEWDVFLPDGRQAGTNSVRETEAGCLLVESWRSAAGGTGTSINYYDPATALWVQQWVSFPGLLISIEGGLRDGAMVLEGHLTAADGETQPFRGTWTPNPDGSVRQYFEISADAGTSWEPWFDGRYVRR